MTDEDRRRLNELGGKGAESLTEAERQEMDALRAKLVGGGGWSHARPTIETIIGKDWNIPE